MYHEAVPEDQALAIMEEGRGSHFDPFLFGVFLGLVPEIRRIAAENPDDRAGEQLEGLGTPLETPLRAMAPAPPVLAVVHAESI